MGVTTPFASMTYGTVARRAGATLTIATGRGGRSCFLLQAASARGRHSAAAIYGNDARSDKRISEVIGERSSEHSGRRWARLCRERSKFNDPNLLRARGARRWRAGALEGCKLAPIRPSRPLSLYPSSPLALSSPL